MRSSLKTKLAPSGWDRVLNDFIDSEAFITLMTSLQEEYEKGNATPSIEQVFNVFYECPYNDLKVVIVGQDPYTDEGVADGFAFSCGNDMNIQPELSVMFDEITETVYADEKWYACEPSLKRWANQGVLLLNTAFTAEVGKLGAHYDIWKPFVKYLFKKLVEFNTGLVYIYVGDVAKEWAKMIPESNSHKFYCYHPNTACYSGIQWESNDVFARTNEILESNNGLKIIW